MKNIEDAYTLSPMQQGMLFHSLFEPESQVYIEQLSYQIEGELNLAAFEQAWQQVVDRHCALRTAFVWENLEKPHQIVCQRVKLPWHYYDWRGLSLHKQQEDLEDFLKCDRELGFQLKRAPLMRLSIIHLAEKTYQIVWSHHHLILDGWSSFLLLKEVMDFYQAYCNGQKIQLEKPRPYRDYIAWLQQQNHNEAEAYWRKRLKGFSASTSLRLERNSLSEPTENLGQEEQEIQLSVADTAAIQSFAKKHQLTLNTLIQGLWALILGCYSGENDVVFGATSSGRPVNWLGAESAIGLFINTLPVRVKLSSEITLVSWLKQIQAEQIEARQYEYSPLFEIQQWSEIPKGTSLFESIIVFENYPIDISLQEWIASLKIGNIKLFEKTNYPLTIAVENKANLSIKILCDRYRFEKDAIARLLQHWQTLLKRVITNPELHLQEISLLSEEEEKTLLVDWNDTQVDYPQEKCIHQRFEEQAEKTPDAIALVFENLHLTYRELNDRAERLAHYLQSLGIKPDVIVGICMERSLEMVIGILAILKAGGAYLPLEPSYPHERLAFMMADAQVSVLLTQDHLVETLPSQQAQVICFDTDAFILNAYQNQENPLIEVKLENLAYVIYTSGSTGTPKGVLNTHLGLSNRLLWMQDEYHLTNRDRILQKTPFSFDVSVWEFFWPLFTGATLVVAKPEGHRDSAYLVNLITSEQITTLHFVPSMLEVFVCESQMRKCHSLQRVFCSGEALSLSLIERFFARVDAELHNLYGPTEAAIDVTHWCCQHNSEHSFVPIGRPIANTKIYILAPNLKPVPMGVTGELHLGGIGLAKGYLNRTELTEERFIANPFQQGERLYKTGDLARYHRDGTIEYLGRIDHQVKIRGFRIELGEIEAILTQHSAIQEAVVLAREDETKDKYLVAYTVPKPGAIKSNEIVSQLSKWLSDRLPSYMIPAVFVTLDKLPLTANGKVNRRALPAPDWEHRDLKHSYIAPRTPTEKKLVSIWTEVLKVKQIGICDNFFELGGHSLLATQAISKIRQTFQIELPLRALFESPTIAQLVESIESQQQSKIPAINPVSRDGALPLSYAQQRLWFISQLEPESSAYNIFEALQIQGKLQINALEKSFKEIIQRHEILRTNFTTQAGKPTQIIHPAPSFSLPTIDLIACSQTQQELEIQRLLNEEEQYLFNLEQEPLLRVTLLKLAPEKHLLLLTMHHIISDGWSTGILIRELVALYQAYCQGQRSPLPQLPIQYADFAAWQRQWLQGEVLETQLSYWKQHLGGELPRLELPTDYPRSLTQSYQGTTKSFTISPSISEKLKALSQQEDVTLFMLLLAAWQVLLYRYTGQKDIVIGTPIANRDRSEIGELIGFFVNTLVIQTDLSGNPSFRELLKRVRKVALAAYAHQNLPFELLVDELQPARHLDRNPLFDVMFTLENASAETLEIPGLSFNSLHRQGQTTIFDLTVSMKETAQGLSGAIEYRTDLFAASTIERIAGHFQVLLEAIVSQSDRYLSDLPVLTASEQKQLLVEWNDTSADYPTDKCIHQLFEERVKRTPNALAVVFEDQHLTYQELNDRANQLAHYLQKLGAQPEKLVGIYLEGSLEMAIAILGVLKAGGAYIPLDPAYPQERLSSMLEDAQIEVLITQQPLANKLLLPQIKQVNLDLLWDLIAQLPTENCLSQVSSENLAYVIYTSGSTGKPKGVAVSHHALVNYTLEISQQFNLQQGDRFLQFASIGFDVVVEEIFPTWLSGATVVLRSSSQLIACTQFLDLIEKEQLTVFELPTAYWHQWVYELSHSHREMPASVRLVIVGGEQISPERLTQWQQFNIPLVHVYGLTETTVTSTLYYLPSKEFTSEVESNLPIGKAIANTQIYLLDSHLQPVPVGVTGEIYIGGASLARGYLDRSQMTATRFIPHPFSVEPGARLYKTGDLGLYLPDGNLECLGRSDRQVKIRGFRIELGEIESVLSGHPSLKEVIVLAREESRERKRLVAYVVPKIQNSVTESELISQLRQWLSDRLPAYMMPSAFVILPELPLTTNGKVDRFALPLPEWKQKDLQQTDIIPHSLKEEKLVQIWTEVLNVERVGIHDNFFELGGDSILSLQVVAKANQIGLHLTPKQLFQHQTIAELASVVGITEQNVAEQGLVTGSFPLTPMQTWFFEQNFPVPHHWNQAVLLETKQEINPLLLEQAIQSLLVHHDLLRVRFHDRQPIITDERAIPFTQVDFSVIPPGQLETAIITTANHFQTSLNLSKGNLLRVGLFQLGSDRSSRLLVVIHHLVIDNVSWRILLEDLQTAYQQLKDKKPINLPPKTTSFKQWSEQIQQYANSLELQSQLDEWLSMLHQPIKPLPVDYPGADNRVADARTVSVALNVEETQALLQEVPAVYRTQINDVLLTALVETFARWTGERSLLLDLEGHGREEIFDNVDLSRTVGWFTAVFPVLLNLEQTVEPGDALKAIKEQLRNLSERGISYGLLRYLAQKRENNKILNLLPKSEVIFNYLGQFDRALSESSFFKLAKESSGNSESLQNSRSHLLEINSSVISGSLQIEWIYSEKLHQSSTIETLAQGFIEALRSLITHCQTTRSVDFTPSDFPLIKFTQEQLDSVFDQISFLGR
jgi:amino acid adenylation domain-containing protein/non-ribosomal peptide synthase protein (TIGR01720 family)